MKEKAVCLQFASAERRICNTRIVLIGYDDTDFFNETCDAWRKNTRTDFILYD